MTSAVAFRFLADLTGPVPAFRPMACTAFPSPAGTYSRPLLASGSPTGGEPGTEE